MIRFVNEKRDDIELDLHQVKKYIKKVQNQKCSSSFGTRPSL